MKKGAFFLVLRLPYGKTIKTYDENERFREEYAVRHDTTITLNTKEYINEGSLLLGFDTREVRVHSTQITEIYPDVKVESAYITKSWQLRMQQQRKIEYQACQKENYYFSYLARVGDRGLPYWSWHLLIHEKKKTSSSIRNHLKGGQRYV